MTIFLKKMPSWTERWFHPLGFALLLVVLFKFAVLHGVYWSVVKGRKVHVTPQTVQRHVFFMGGSSHDGS